MTNKVKKELGLKSAWDMRLTMWAEGNKLQTEASKLHAEASKLHSEGSKLWAKADKAWAEAILEAHGDIKRQWLSRNKGLACKLETGEIFEP
jgi:hypothetical protein